jgi:hypothetical protein
MALSPKRNSFAFKARGASRLVNASSLVVVGDDDHWLVGVGRGLVRPVGRIFHMSYSIFDARHKCSPNERRLRPPFLITNGCSLF